ncbi:MAG TPA: hypothetical protein VMY05_05380 [Acidobacteriota bacterium]|nr:hypothetical protein [Acidobacteriota bacterium]
MSTEQECRFTLKDNTPCGQTGGDAAKGMCRFHQWVRPDRLWARGDLSAIKQYVTNCKQEFVDFAGIRFDGVDFAGLLGTEKRLLFEGSQFTKCTFKACVFYNASFIGECVFKDTVFRKCEFRGTECSFEDSVFDSDAIVFDECTFILTSKDELDPTAVSFKGCDASIVHGLFRNCYVKAYRFDANGLQLIGKDVHPKLALFVTDAGQRLKTDMLCLDSVHQVLLSGLQFRGVFTYRQHQEYGDFVPRLDLTQIDFDKMLSAHLFDANLKKAWFRNSSIEAVKFHNCRWPKKGEYKYLPEDGLSEKALVKDDSELLRLYVQLKKNFETNGDFIGAGDWHFREMEARRRLKLGNSKGPKRLLYKCLSLICWYKRLSNYGESYARPLIWIIAVWFVFSWIYLFSGFVESGAFVNLDVFHGHVVSVRTFLDHLLKAMLFSFLAMTLQVGRGANLQGSWLQFWHSLQLLLTAVLVPLMLLAVRRKFRR